MVHCRMLVLSSKPCNWMGTNGFKVRTENEWFIVICSRCRQNLRFANFALLFCECEVRAAALCLNSLLSEWVHDRLGLPRTVSSQAGVELIARVFHLCHRKCFVLVDLNATRGFSSLVKIDLSYCSYICLWFCSPGSYMEHITVAPVVVLFILSAPFRRTAPFVE